MPENPDNCVPQAVTDFLFDLYDSVTLSQLTEEQQKLYTTALPDLSQKYFASTPWPSATSIASECNGDPLFLAVYRELSHRHWHSVSRPTLADRMEGWDVYRELFDEILEGTPNFYLLPVWVFEILHEFVYQFQGFCQIRTAVYSAAKKHGMLDANGNPTGADVPSKHSNLAENLQLLQNNTDAWDVEAVFSYLHRLIETGMPREKKPEDGTVKPVYSFFALFGSIALSRLECLLGDYTATLQALDGVHVYSDTIIPKDENHTFEETVTTVMAARVSLAYHAGIAYMQLRRYKDASAILLQCAGSLQRGFKTGALRQQSGSDQFNKQYERILSLLAILQQICPGMHTAAEESVLRAVREKYGSKIEAAGSFEEWFQSPKFIAADPSAGTIHRQQVEIFNAEMKPVAAGKNLRSYLKLYTSLPVQKLAHFHDFGSVTEFMPSLLSYKIRMRQMERGDGDSYSEGSMKSALDIHFYVENDSVNVDEAEIQRRFETYFVGQIDQCCEIRQEAVAIDMVV